MINVDHSACLALAGTFEPCYILTVSTVASQMQPVTNKRNAALIQSFMADILSVPPERGIIRFIAIPEENLAMNGTTMQGEIERMEKQGGDVVGPRPTNRRSQTFNTTASKRNSLQVSGDQLRPNGLSIAEKRRSIPSGVFELAGSDERPSTSHGTYAAENGLRLNGISREDLLGKESKTPNGRPKTFGGQSAKRESTSRGSQPPSTANGSAPGPPIKPKQPNIPISPRPTQPASKAPANGPTAALPKSVTRPTSSVPVTKSSAPTTTSTSTPAPTSTSTTATGSAEAAAKRAADIKRAEISRSASKSSTSTKTNPTSASAAAATRESTANTAKRRSTITATPKIPHSHSSANHPPPPPEPLDRSDAKSQRVSKRKSFLSAFRR